MAIEQKKTVEELDAKDWALLRAFQLAAQNETTDSFDNLMFSTIVKAMLGFYSKEVLIGTEAQMEAEYRKFQISKVN